MDAIIISIDKIRSQYCLGSEIFEKSISTIVIREEKIISTEDKFLLIIFCGLSVFCYEGERVCV